MRGDRNSNANSDLEVAVVLIKEQYPAPGYNVQLASEHQVILAYGGFSKRSDDYLLEPMKNQIHRNMEGSPKILITDAGYGNKKTIKP